MGIYSTTPTELKFDDSNEVAAEINAWPHLSVAHPKGSATIETYTVRRDDGRQTGIVIGRLRR